VPPGCGTLGAVVLTRSGRSHGALHLRSRQPRRWFRWVVAVLVLVAALAVAAAVRVMTMTVPSLSATRVLAGSVTIPGSAPRVAWPTQGQAAAEVQGIGGVGSTGADNPQPIASLAKVMTAYVVLHDHPLPSGQSGFSVTIGSADVADYQNRLAQAESVMPVAEGEQLTELQLLEGLLVASANNVGPILAKHDAGSEAAFVARMNSTARTLGMAHTTYTDASGFNSTTVSTATDQLVLATRAMANPVFAKVVAMSSVDLPVAGTVSNFDRAVGSNGFVGIKTGSDSSAGGCFMFANRQTIAGHPVTIIGVLLGLDRGETSTDALITASTQAAASIVDSVARAIGVHTIVPAGTTVETVTNAQGHKVAATTTRPLTYVGWGGQTFQLQVTTVALGRSLKAGQDVATVGSTGEPGAQTSVAATSSMPAVSWSWRLRHAL
jgi:serine-type D-Ala-D-Ala carboxypeptidase (penicillin-binding protein 5/6)